LTPANLPPPFIPYWQRETEGVAADGGVIYILLHMEWDKKIQL
jgi:hypothetical protein